MLILHSYILRELLKTFGLTLFALTALFTMGGGLYNLVSREGLTAADIMGIVPQLLPIVITLTMPIAALFTVTIVYGRLADDNELLACRAAGINVHRMFFSAGLLALFVAAFTFIFGNFVIARFVGQIEGFARRNIRDLVAQSLERRGFISRPDKGSTYTLTAEEVLGVSDQALRAKGFDVAAGLQYLLVRGPTFLDLGPHGELRRFSAAREGLVIFDTRPTPIELTLLVRDGRDFAVGERAVEVRQQQIGPLRMPTLPSSARLSTSTLNDLLRWRKVPWEAPRLRDEVTVFRVDLLRDRLAHWALDEILAGRGLTFFDDLGQSYHVQASTAALGRRGIALHDVSIAVDTPRETRPTRYEAAEAELLAAPLGTRLVIELRLIQTADHDVLEYNPRFGDAAHPRHKATLSLDGLQVPETLVQAVADVPAVEIFDPTAPLDLSDELATRRASLQNSAADVGRKIVSTMNLRVAYMLSTLVTALMGAALGVIFRGGRALAAFGLSMIPFFSVTILLVLGQKLTEDPHAHTFGPPVTWGGLIAVLIADLLILRLGVRR